MLLSDRPALARLCRDYADQLLTSGYRDWKEKPYAYDAAASGLRVDARMRRLYRRALFEAEQNGRSSLPPDPFDPATAHGFVAWLTGPTDQMGKTSRVSRYLTALYEGAGAPDLQVAFPDLRWSDTDRFLGWVADVGQRQENIPPELVPSVSEEAAPTNGQPVPRNSRRVSTSQAISARSGDRRSRADRSRRSKRREFRIRRSRTEPEHRAGRGHPFEHSGATEPLYDINVICVNADRLWRFASDIGPDFFRGRHSIGVWFWEAPRSRRHARCVRCDRRGVRCSAYVRDAIAAETEKPVHILPLPVRVPEDRSASRADLGMPEAYVFLFSSTSSASSSARTRSGLIEALPRRSAEARAGARDQEDQRRHGRDALERLRAAAATGPTSRHRRVPVGREKNAYGGAATATCRSTEARASA